MQLLSSRRGQSHLRPHHLECAGMRKKREINTIRVKELLRAQNVTLDWPTLLVFTTAQARQDNGIPWGEALAAAKADKGDQ